MRKVQYLAMLSAIGGILTFSAAPAMARVDVEVSFGVPGVYVQPAPVYIQPRPVYGQPYPVYVQPQPIYVQPQPVYGYPRVVYDNGRVHRGWRHHHHHNRHHRDRDFDRDGVPDYRDGDRDGDGVSNRDDRRPNDGYRY